MVEPAVLEAERRRIFDRCWIYAGHESEVRAPGDFQTRTAGRPIILCRDRGPRPRVPQRVPPSRRDGVPRAVRQCARLQVLLSRLELRPRRVPRRRAGQSSYPASFDRAVRPRRAAARRSYRGFVFVSFDADALPLEDYLAGAQGVPRPRRGPVAHRRDGDHPRHAGIRHPRQLEAAGREQLRRLPPDEHAQDVARLHEEVRRRDPEAREGPRDAVARRGQGARQRPRGDRQREFPRAAGGEMDPALRRGGEARDRADPRGAGGAAGRSARAARRRHQPQPRRCFRTSW